MEFRVLGPLEVLKKGRPVRVGGARQRALLAILVSRPNEVVSTDRLVEELWGESPPEGPEHALQAAVSRLRRVLGANGGDDLGIAHLVARPPGYVLEIDPSTIDSRQFERLAAEGHRALATDPAKAAELLAEALALWRGPALAEFTYEPFAQSHIARLEELRLSASEDRIDADLSLGRHGQVVAELEALVADHPYRERLRGQLMLALYRSGRQAEALEVYRRSREVLVEELGVDPGPKLQELEAAILRQDAALLLPAGVGTPASESPTPPTPEELAPQPPRADVRKTVTVAFADIAGSTPLAERLDPEALREVMARYFEVARAAFHRHGGTVEKFVGDAVMAVFGIPTLHEDDALRAVRAASDLRAGLADLNEDLERGWDLGLEIRIGVNTGEVVAGEGSPGQGLVTGDPVNTATRLQEAAEPGEILIGEATYRLVAGAVEGGPPSEVALRGKHDRVVAYKVSKVLPGAPPYIRRLDAPLVGRQAELAQLRQGFDRAVRDRTSYLFTILGDPGIGKTRLAREFASSVEEEATVLTGRCLPYGEGITYWPLRELFHDAFGADVTGAIATLVRQVERSAIIAERVSGALGLAEAAGTVEELNWSVRMVLQALARDRPLTVVFEDLHWAEDAFLNLVEHLADLTTEAPMLLLCLARGELLDTQPTWGGGKRNATTLELEPLDPEDARTLVNNLVDRSAPRHVGFERVMTVAEGNPLFLEQLTAILDEEPAQSLEVALPPTIQALLAGRLEGLGPGQRAVLECAAVIGKEFNEADMIELLPQEARSFLSRHLQELVRKRFVRPAPTPPGKEAVYRFRHVLIQEVAYRGVSKRLRAELHMRFAGRLQAGGEGSEEILGYHLEQASRYLQDLQPHSRVARELAARASVVLASAGRSALVRGDENAAANLLSRAAALPVRGDIRLELLPELCEVLSYCGKFGEAERIAAEAIDQARVQGNHRIEHRAVIERAWLRATGSAKISGREELRTVERALSALEKLGDQQSLARGWQLAAFLLYNAGKAADAERAVEQAGEYARRAGDRKREVWSLASLCTYVRGGPTSVEEGIRLCDEVLVRIRGYPSAEADVLLERASLEAMRGRFPAARDRVSQGRSILEELGQVVGVPGTSIDAATVEILAGNLPRAEEVLRSAYEAFRRMEAEGYVATWAAWLGRVICAQGRDEEALEYTRISEEVAGEDDITAQVPWRATRAKIYGRHGQTEEAERLAREAVDLAEGTDWLDLQGETLMDFGEVLLISGKSLEAMEAVGKALEAWEKKGNLVSASRARALLHRVAALI